MGRHFGAWKNIYVYYSLYRQSLLKSIWSDKRLLNKVSIEVSLSFLRSVVIEIIARRRGSQCKQCVHKHIIRSERLSSVRKRGSSILDGAVSGLVYYLKYPIRTMHKKFELSKFKIKPVKAHLKFESTGKYGTTWVCLRMMSSLVLCIHLCYGLRYSTE